MSDLPLLPDDDAEDIPLEDPGFDMQSPTPLSLTPKPIEIARKQVAINNLAAERENGLSDQNLGFSARVWAQVTLPYRDPGDQQFWVRRNGAITLRVEPASLTKPDGTDYRAFPYGIIPRHIMTWMASEAIRTEKPELDLGGSMNGFLVKLGLNRGQRNRDMAHEQMLRVFNSRLSVEGIALGEGNTGHGSVRRSFQVADDIQLWFSNEDELTNDGLFRSKVTLSDRFFKSIIEHPIPVDLDHLRVIGARPLTVDIYTWLGFRLFALSRPTKMKWDDLYVQFGSQTKRVRDFRLAFAKALEMIRPLFPQSQLKYEITQSFFILYPGPTPVSPVSTKRYITS